MTIKERWKPVKGYEQYYQISNLGRVKRLSGKANSLDKKMIKEKVLKYSRNGSKYQIVQFYINGKRELKFPHRLVAEHFLKNPKRLKCVLLIDESDMTNVSVDNLKWANFAESHNRKSN